MLQLKESTTEITKTIEDYEAGSVVILSGTGSVTIVSNGHYGLYGMTMEGTPITNKYLKIERKLQPGEELIVK